MYSYTFIPLQSVITSKSHLKIILQNFNLKYSNLFSEKPVFWIMSNERYYEKLLS